MPPVLERKPQTRVGAIPPDSRIMAGALQVMARGRAASPRKIKNYLITNAGYTEEQLDELFPTDVRSNWIHAIERSLETLQQYGLAYEIGPGFYTLTRIGEQTASHKPRRIFRATAFLWQVYRRVKDRIIDFLAQLLTGAGKPIVVAMPPQPSFPGRMMQLMVDEHRDLNLLRDPRNETVWFGTNCRPTDPKNLAMGFLPERDDQLHLGRCIVNIPEGHKTGSDDYRVSPAVGGSAEGIVVKRIEGMTASDFWSRLSDALTERVKENSMLLFIHGYTVSFVDAAIRAAQLKYDLKVAHAAFYAWPSKRRLIGYGADVGSADAAAPFLASFLNSLGSLTGEKNVTLHVIAHSMGNFAFLMALDHLLLTLKGQPPGFKLGEVVFAAADVDRDGFRTRAERTVNTARQRTLYASRKDWALRFSEFVRLSYPRAGRIPPVTIAAGDRYN